ncbi:N6-L-threonylcarbamoyladenine synthase [Desulfitispora alkaliphila]|uniref:tRNA (adenosine(37)-N6)-threonylcarbamoyltransferase complex transferase subunit TsaD n=1 Tax=Desulfitispora alkaliphila TaxID=622674 RepID=UPI003D22D4B3
MKEEIILALETSCDETSVALVKGGKEILSNIISSQIETHKVFGGVVPEIASRKHIEAISFLVEQAILEAKINKGDIDAVAVTNGPGLVGALLVGVNYAKAYAYGLGKPLIGVNHIVGHIYANFLEHQDISLPAVCLIVSGGHTHLVYLTEHLKYEIIGQTRDDAAGEAFDKVARAMGLGYPGGPIVDKLSKEGNEQAFQLPRVRLEKDTLDFSFSGLKSASLNIINQAKMKGEDIKQEDLAASFQQAVVDVLTEKAIEASKRKGVKNLLLAGGVAANSSLREELMNKSREEGINLYYPSLKLCTDNGAMIGTAAHYKYVKQDWSDLKLNAIPNLRL